MSVIVTLLLVASVAINVWVFRRKVNRVPRSTRSTLLDGLKNVKEFTTIRQHFQSVVIFKDAKALLGITVPGTVRKFILKYGGVITCGCDLERIRVFEFFAVNRVRVTVPRSKILDVYADIKSIQVYDQKAGLFTSIDLNDQNREIANNLEEVRKEAEAGDILRRADDNVRAVLISLAASLNMEAEIVFEGGVDEAVSVPEQLPAVALESEPAAEYA